MASTNTTGPDVAGPVENPVENAAGLSSAVLWEMGEQTLPTDVADYLLGGAGREQAIGRNWRILDEIAFLPRALAGVSRATAATSIFGKPVAAPVFPAPVGSIDVVQDGAAMAVVDGARAAGMASMVGVLALNDLAGLPHLGDAIVGLQLYLRGDDVWLRDLLAGAEDRGFSAFCVTIDSPVPAYRPRDRRNSFDHRTVTTGPQTVPGGIEGRELQGQLSWERLERIREMTRLPLVVKGILRADDAVRAVERGFDAVYVSNHGGRNLGASPAPVERLPEIVDAVAGRAAVYVDGGVRDGEDVARALALGADAVGVGRAQCLALAAAGASGVEALLTDLKRQLETTMALVGVRDVDDLDSDVLLVPPTFGAWRTPDHVHLAPRMIT